MKNSTQKLIATLVGSGLLSVAAIAQWCVPTTLIPYDANMPGITNFTLGSINRTSAANEHGTANNYTLCTETTSLTAGTQYTLHITFNIDAQICPDMNLRVWIDFNQDGQLDDPGETVISANNQLPGIYTGTFTVPSNATLGSTRLRVVSKMTSNGGHTLPTPCDIPTDPAGYHGGMEDYNITIVAPSAVNEISSSSLAMTLFPNPANATTNISYTLSKNSAVTMEIFNMVGEKVAVLENANEQIGNHTTTLDVSDMNLSSGIYFIVLKAGETTETRKLIVSTL
ncbi:MAG TPA: GEVED domain-containing protein [Bacteroidia bacterium]|nr:GEVED domain-containing protein [Bacteroidia bacterium]